MSLASVHDKIGEATQDASEENYILATVTENVDPLGISRIKVDAPGIFEPNKNEVPWVGSHIYSPFGQGVGYGTYGSPWIGSLVKVKLQNGDTNHGQYEASAYSVKNANAKFKSPKTWGYIDPTGNELFVNMETNVWEWQTHTGFKLFYDGTGHLTLTAPNGIVENITNDLVINVTGNANVTVNGSINAHADGPINVTTDSSATVASNGTMTIQGSTINLN